MASLARGAAKKFTRVVAGLRPPRRRQAALGSGARQNAGPPAVPDPPALPRVAPGNSHIGLPATTISLEALEVIIDRIPPAQRGSVLQAARSGVPIVLTQVQLHYLLGLDSADLPLPAAAPPTAPIATAPITRSDWGSSSKRIAAALSLPSTVQKNVPEASALSADQWKSVKALTVAFMDARQKVRTDAEFCEVVEWVLRRISKKKGRIFGHIWEYFFDLFFKDICNDFAYAPRWAMMVDLRETVSLSTVQHFHRFMVSVAQGIYERYGLQLAWNQRGSGVPIPGKDQVRAVLRGADERMALRYPYAVLHDHGYGGLAILTSVEHSFEQELVVHSLVDVVGDSPENPVYFALTGDGGKATSSSRTKFTAFFLRFFCGHVRLAVTGSSLGTGHQGEGQVCPVAIAIGSETMAQWHEQLGPAFGFAKACMERGGYFWSTRFKKHIYVRPCFAADMSTCQKIDSISVKQPDGSTKYVCRCTGAKARHENDFFCLFCACSNHAIDQPNTGVSRCDVCKENDDEKCYHRPVSDKPRLRALQVNVDSLKAAIGGDIPVVYFAQVLGFRVLTDAVAASMGLTGPAVEREAGFQRMVAESISAVPGREGQPNHLDYPQRTPTEKAKFAKRLDDALSRLGHPPRGSFKAKKKRLRELLLRIYKAIECLREIEHRKTGDAPCNVPLECLLGCLLHMWKSCSTRAIWLLVHEIFDKNKRPDLTNAAQRASVLHQVEDVVNAVLGTQPDTRWSFTLDSASGILEPTGIEIFHLKALVMDHWRELVALCCPSGARHAELTEFFTVFVELFTCLECPWTTPTLISNIERLSHRYFALGVKSWGRDFAVNYSHYLGSGHVTWMYKQGHNLKQLEQAVVERLMGVIKKIYINRTARRGTVQGPCGKRRQTALADDVFRVLLRRHGWQTGQLLSLVEPQYKLGTKLLLDALDADTAGDDDGNYSDAGSVQDRDRDADDDAEMSEPDDDYSDAICALFMLDEADEPGRPTRAPVGNRVKRMARATRSFP